MEKFKEVIKNTLDTERHFINELLWYTIESQNLFIHLAQDDSISVFQKVSLYKQGLSDLAHELGANPQLKNIHSIVAIAKIVKEHPELLERFGFTVFDYGNDEKNIEELQKMGVEGIKLGTPDSEGIAIMPRIKLLETYTKK